MLIRTLLTAAVAVLATGMGVEAAQAGAATTPQAVTLLGGEPVVLGTAPI